MTTQAGPIHEKTFFCSIFTSQIPPFRRRKTIPCSFFLINLFLFKILNKNVAKYSYTIYLLFYPRNGFFFLSISIAISKTVQSDGSELLDRNRIVYRFQTMPLALVVGGCEGREMKSNAFRNTCLRTKSLAAELRFVLDP